MATVNTEESALLGMEGVELHTVQQPFSSFLSSDALCMAIRVPTDRGDILVAVQGDRSKPAIFTYHDLGLNFKSFRHFFRYTDMRLLLQKFCVYHINAPGQEENARTLPDDYVYPTVDELAHQLNFVMARFGVKSFIGMGVGAGAYILTKFALTYPESVDALAVINCTSSQAGWLEWGYQKINIRSLRTRGMTQAVLDYLMWHHFGRFPQQRNQDLVSQYRDYFTRHMNPINLALLAESYLRRSNLNLSREGNTLKPPVLNITGALSPHVDDTVVFNGRLNPNNSSWMKISDCGNVLAERPGKVSEAFRLFLQGEGIVAPLSPTKLFAEHQLEELKRRRACRLSPVIRITENPISEAVAC